ncbi:MAG: UDP-N-acetylmuramate--alanine ligase [Ponticaulis sp.]|nr:UDP-N-acetylmuramate--alanine ligase [Ponticaulis sp.]
MTKSYFFCGIGGSGMLPLAMILKGQGAHVSGSDRARDQGRSTEKFAYLEAQGFELFPQDGSGLREGMTLVASAAVEDTVPDVAAALKFGCPRLGRAELLSSLFNEAPKSIGVAGTSGKSTTTGMIGWVLQDMGLNPTVMNGAVMKNFATPEALFASALVGDGKIFVSEVDESDGSIARYNPTVALINNIALDHKTMDELRELFEGFARRADVAVLNDENDETQRLNMKLLGHDDEPEHAVLSYSLNDPMSEFTASEIEPGPTSISFRAHSSEDSHKAANVTLRMPGVHNVYNALAAIAAVTRVGVSFEDACESLGRFEGIKRRFDIVGTTDQGVTVIDDFGHNPDKISATLRTLHDFPGRLLVMFQPHGFGPLRKMKDEFVETFVNGLDAGDVLLMPQPVYFGGTVDRSVTSKDLTDEIAAAGRQAETFETRAECGDRLVELAQPGDRIIVMGARDDTLSEFAAGVLSRV